MLSNALSLGDMAKPERASVMARSNSRDHGSFPCLACANSSMRTTPGTPTLKPERTAWSKDIGLPVGLRKRPGVAARWCGLSAVERRDGFGSLVPMDEKRAAAQPGRLRLDQSQHHLDGDRRIDGAAAFAQDFKPCLGRQRIRRRDHVPGRFGLCLFAAAAGGLWRARDVLRGRNSSKREEGEQRA